MKRSVVPDRDSAHHRVDALREIPLEPLEYCRKYVKDAEPGERGYRKACIQVLAEALPLSDTTINSWGANFEKRPEYVLFILRQSDIINQIKALVNLKPEDLQE